MARRADSWPARRIIPTGRRLLRHVIADAAQQLGKFCTAVRTLATTSGLDEIPALSTSLADRAGAGKMRHPRHCLAKSSRKLRIGLSEGRVKEMFVRFVLHFEIFPVTAIS